MKTLKITIFIWLLAVQGVVQALHFDGGECKAYNGSLIITWVSQDTDGLHSIHGAVGNIGDAPNLWTKQDITAGSPSHLVSIPKLYMNSIGDVVAIWNFYDHTLKTVRVAAARLPGGDTTWLVDIISPDSSDESAEFKVFSADIDNSGNIFVTWTSLDKTTVELMVQGIAGTVSTGFGLPFFIDS